MTLNEYQDQAGKTAIYPNKGNNLTYPILGLVGELMEAREKLRTENDELEWSDVCWYTAAVCTELSISLSEIADYCIENLEATTPQENVKHALTKGLTPPTDRNKLMRTVLTDQDVLDIRALLNIGNISQKELAEYYDVLPNNISRVFSANRGKVPNEKVCKYIDDTILIGIGALAEQAKRIYRDDNQILTEDRKNKLIAELAKIFRGVSLACWYAGYSITEVMEKNIKKLQSRQERGVLQGSGDSR